MKRRNIHVDVAKGILILLVIVGHYLPGTLQNNPVRFTIYSFHMPAFFFIGGYLTNTHRIKSETCKQFFKRYFKRLFLPWLLAVNVYYSLDFQLSLKSYIGSYVFPYYHLWYTLGYFFCILIAFFCIRHIHTRNWVHIAIFLGVLFSLIYIIMYRWQYTNVIPLRLFFHTIRPWNLLYFSIGMKCKEQEIKVNTTGKELVHIHIKKANVLLSHKYITRCLLFLFMVFLPFGYIFQDSSSETAVQYILLACLFLSLKMPVVNENETNEHGKNVTLRLLSLIGHRTYPIYLWHVLGKKLMLHLTKGRYDAVYWGGVLLFVTLLIAMVLMINRNKQGRIISALIGR